MTVIGNGDNGSGSGVSFLGLLGILFIGLRLAGCIDWPWWLVLLPLWGPLALAVAAVVTLALAQWVAEELRK